ncbi:MAG: TldD/PmbA family protein [Chlorobiales bacterium]|jgi:predicted Zn-dependent protease|nr:TldD/PmbA family protein [Chlorobiales bacterium]
MILAESDAKALVDKVLSFATADSTQVSLVGTEQNNIRFALNSITTNGFQDDLRLTVTSSLGSRTGAFTINQLSDKAIREAVQKAEELARLAPEDPEFLLPLGKQTYLSSTTFYDSTASATMTRLAALCKPVVEEAERRKVDSAGYIHTNNGFSVMATSSGMFIYEKETGVDFTVTARTSNGTGSGWAGNLYHDLDLLDTAELGRVAIDKSILSQNPVTIEPGKYTVILEPSAVADLIGWMLLHFEARSADEGRSFLTKEGGTNNLGKKLLGKNVSIYSDPNDTIAPGSVYSTDGLPMYRTNWIENGIVKNLIYSRYWAEKSGVQPIPFPTNVIMTGGKSSVDEMIKSVKKGILVTRLWYIRDVDPRTLLVTGLTRDGSFLIENGEITKPVKNMRFNESPVSVLSNIDAMGESVRARGSEIEEWSFKVPPLLVSGFSFSSVSDAV